MSRMGDRYWAKRAAARMAEEEQSAQGRLSMLSGPYRRAQGAILAQIKGIQSAYMRRYGVSEEDMRLFLSRPADKKTLERLARAVAQMPEGREKRRLQAQLNAPATRYRISNLQAMREHVQAITRTLSGEEQSLFTDSLTKTIRESYLRDSYDLQKRAGVLLEPNGISNRFVRQALREDWSGKNYKTRIEGRYEDLAERVRESVLQGFLGGGSQARMAEDIAREFGASYHAAKRLMTTETCYVMNTAHVEGFEEYAVPEYRIIAVLDLRTSDICQEQDGKIYKRGEAVAGETMPPFHPNCRSTVSPVTDRKWLETMVRRATDPVTGETETLPPGTTYPQWLRMIEERYGKEKIDALREEQKAKVRAKNEAVQRKIERNGRINLEHDTSTETEFPLLPTKKISINEAYISSGEYAARYNGITGNPIVDKRIAVTAQEILKHRSGTTYEDLALFDARTGELLYRLDDSTIHQGITYTGELRRAIDEAHEANKDIIALHNHPNNFPPSVDDGSSARYHGYVKGIVACHDGRIFTYTPTDEVLSTSDCSAIHDLIKEEFSETFDLKRAWLTITREFGMLIQERE